MTHQKISQTFDISSTLKERFNQTASSSHRNSDTDGTQNFSIYDAKSTRHFSSQRESVEALIKRIKESMMSDVIHSNDIVNIKKLKVNATVVSNAIKDLYDVALRHNTDGSSTVFLMNYDTGLMTLVLFFVKDVINSLTLYSNIIEINDLDKLTKDVMSKLMHNPLIRKFTMPDENLILFKNDIVIDTKQQKMIEFDEVKHHYDFVQKNNANFVITELQSEKQKVKSTLYRSIINRVMKDWASDDSQTIELLWQVIYAVIKGKNFGKFFILKGPGGNGKSTYMNLLSIIAGPSQTEIVNIHQFGDPNSINTINSSTKVIIGDDAATNSKMSGSSLSNLKSIVTGDPLSVPVKYSHNVVIQSNALFVQGTNTDISIFENNQAVKSRMIVIEWSPIDFRSNKPSEITFDLDKLMKQQEFIDEWVTMCIENVDDFDTFTIPERSRTATSQLIESNDTIHLFLSDIIPLIDGFKEVPLMVLYECFVDWSRSVNSGSSVIKYVNFLKLVADKSENFKFELPEDRKRFTKMSSKASLTSILEITDKNFKHFQRYLEFDNPIDSQEIEEFTKLQHPIDNLNHRQLQIAAHLMFELNDSSMSAHYMNEFN